MNLVTNRAALAVGTAALSSEDMYMAGGRGKYTCIQPSSHGMTEARVIRFNPGLLP